jgi:hypothetical protein
MGVGYWLRVVGMVIVLTAVVWAIHTFNKGQAGFPIIAERAAPVLAMCPTRIVWLDAVATGEHLEEHNTHWMKNISGSPMEELDAVSTEKWFSRLCRAELAKSEQGGEWKLIMKIGYVGNQERDLKADSNHNFEIDGISFTSKDLEKTLSALASIPKAKKPGQ